MGEQEEEEGGEEVNEEVIGKGRRMPHRNA
jgi:hypothetical protein